jgi:hypothetical protein
MASAHDLQLVGGDHGGVARAQRRLAGSVHRRRFRGGAPADDKGHGAKDLAAAEMDRRATAIAERLKTIAVRGQPAFDRLAARLTSKLKPVPGDRIVQPPATIEAPAVLHYMLLGDGDEVAELRALAAPSG